MNPGDRVRFREGTPPHAKNAGVVFVVGPAGSRPDNTGPFPRAFVWLVHEEDVALPPSRQRGRSGYVDALERVP